LARVVVEGEVLDPPEAEELYNCLCAVIERGARRVAVDLGRVPILSSVGINALIRAYNAGSALGCALCVVATSELVARVLEATGVDQLLLDPRRDEV
jgi:anti-anti-sigma factor